jgi:peptidoglycan/LPS O-acetylase OafA/YrhL
MEKQPNFLPRAEALRGLAAFAVLGFHAAGAGFDIVATGMAPVVVFFVLSGFLLGRSLDHNADVLRFLRHRAFRLFPAAIATVALLTFLYRQFDFYPGFMPNIEPLNLVLNAFLIRSDINGVMWSLTVELAAIPVILISHRMFCTYGPVPLICLALLLYGLSFWGAYVHALGGITNLAPLYSFVVGMLGYFYATAIQRRFNSPRVTQAVEAAALALIFVAGLRKQTAHTILAETMSATVLLVMVASTNRITVLGSLLDTGIARFLGRISYSFFLLHVIGLLVALRLLPVLPPLPYVLLTFAVAAVVTVPMAWLLWRYVEVPFIHLGKQWFPSKWTTMAKPEAVER